MQQTAKLTVRLPGLLHRRLKKQAQATKRSLNRVIVEALWRDLGGEETQPLSEYERTMQVIRESGLLATLGPEWDRYIEDAPDMTHEEIREALRGLSPLSEDIIADRGPR
ncbi:MAG: toxin-antitoxin system HicB family antitoxin [Anaerolineae bacterium]|nr:toxin-antitoxin system HicB family antitoxin [Anaerolineae bacterium]